MEQGLKSMLFFLFIGLALAVCTERDRLIFRAKGTTFPHMFRTFGGLWTSRERYEDKVRLATGLTRACAACYGQAYVCGFQRCKWDCMEEGYACDECLAKAGCIGACNKCTGFV